MNACSLDLRKRVMDYLNAGHTMADTAEHFSVNISSVQRWKKLLKETGSLEVTPTPRGPHKLFLEPLKEYVDANNDATLETIAAHFGCAVTTVWNALQKLGYTRKKNRKNIKKGMKNKDKHLSMKQKRKMLKI